VSVGGADRGRTGVGHPMRREHPNSPRGGLGQPLGCVRTPGPVPFEPVPFCDQVAKLRRRRSRVRRVGQRTASFHAQPGLPVLPNADARRGLGRTRTDVHHPVAARATAADLADRSVGRPPHGSDGPESRPTCARRIDWLDIPLTLLVLDEGPRCEGRLDITVVCARLVVVDARGVRRSARRGDLRPAAR